MKVTVEKRWLMIPFCDAAQYKKLILRENGRIAVELDARIGKTADCKMPYDMGAYLGKTLECSVTPEIAFVPEWSDTPYDDTVYTEKYRPAAHFSTKRGWINDPNGLVWYEGKYHLFYQHNPVDPLWGNMHWGHAVSGDLVHWEELGDAMFPDEYGAMFSGSAMIDHENVTGLKENEHDPLLLFYTAAGGHGLMSEDKPSSQHMAYSTDGGYTFKKYGCVIPTVTRANRDPKVVWCDEKQAWVIPIYLDGREFALYTSKDLLHWEEIQRICIEEDDECPDLYPLDCEGERFWVMTAAHDRYLVVKFEGGHFIPKYSTGRLHYGRRSYAAQTFFNAPDNRRVRFGWNQSTLPGMPFNGSMTTPHDMTLKPIGRRPMLCAWPSVEFEALRTEKAEGVSRLALTGRANDIELRIPAGGKRVLRLLGLELTVDADAMTVSKGSEGRRVFVDGKDNGVCMPVRAENGCIRLRVIQDVHSVEIYAGQGEATLCLDHLSDYSLDRVECEGASITAWALKDIHNGK